MGIYLGALCLLVLAFHVPLLKTSRQLMLTVANYLFVGLLVPGGQNWAGLACFIVVTYWFLLLIKARPSYNFVVVLILATFVMFLVLKGYLRSEAEQLQAWMNSVDFLHLWAARWRESFGALEIVGLSYMLFKFIDALVHQWEGQLEPCDFLTYVNYQLAFFTLLAGPIQRYNQFYRFWNDMDLLPSDERETLLDWSRLLMGILKMGAVAPLIARYLLFTSVPIQADSERFLCQFYAYPVYLYMNFSGYTDLAIGSARLLGFQLPENFDRPFAARNLLEFWNRWHMSLTHWVRDLVFMPAYKRAVEAKPRWAKPAGYLLLVLSMGVVGLWHGITASFAIFGLINGLGVAINQIYADGLRALLSRPALKRYQQNRWFHAAAWLLTYHFVCFSFLFFTFNWSEALGLAQAVGSQVPMFAAIALVFLWFVPGQRTMWAILERIRTGLRPRLAPLYGLVFVQAFLVVLLQLTLWAFDQPAPEVIYRRF